MSFPNTEALGAVVKQNDFLTKAFKDSSTHEGGRVVLEFGCGPFTGVARSIFEALIKEKDLLWLYDSDTSLCDPPAQDNVEIVTCERVFSPSTPPLSVISLSYVISAAVQQALWLDIKKMCHLHPQALFAITDYTLEGFPRSQVCDLLSGDLESYWKKRIGEKAFIRSRTGLSVDDLARFLKISDLELVEGPLSLDEHGHRTAFVARSKVFNNERVA